MVARRRSALAALPEWVLTFHPDDFDSFDAWATARKHYLEDKRADGVAVPDLIWDLRTRREQRRNAWLLQQRGSDPDGR